MFSAESEVVGDNGNPIDICTSSLAQKDHCLRTRGRRAWRRPNRCHRDGKGTTSGTSADIDGNFTITVPSNATLVVSYVGCDPMGSAYQLGQTHLNIVMKRERHHARRDSGDRIRFGKKKNPDATGSVAIVTPDDVEAGISTSAQDLA